MSSSDSEDDCYGNVARKLQQMKNKYVENKVECSNLLNESSEIEEIVKKADFGAKTDTNTIVNSEKVNDVSFDFSDDPELDSLIAGSYKRVTRASSRRTKNDTQEVSVPTKRKSDEGTCETSRGRRGRERGKRGQNVGNDSICNDSESGSQNESRGRGRRGKATPRGRRGRGRNRAINNFLSHNNQLPVSDIHPAYPIYSVGNTDEYPDQCEDQGLFSKKPQPKKDIVVIDDDDPLDENEELSVKVYWQSSEFFKFTIRKYQKITSIFDYFAKKENVSHDKLFFMFNDCILKPDDTPDLIKYNIAKFIDGGIVNQSIANLVTKVKGNVTNGIKLKFQCQNVKKPFETVVGLAEKLSVAMLKCAEHFDISIDKLRFEFDGDLISGKNTAQDLDLEGGECIDVKIAS
ncbi:uncharacterized protein Rad60 [Plodia interpunctella]|uniref:uncharacterized protein Rad60 n=1 Tax=Plodia interpunctella TaxID=58824 RepID=UPI002368D2B9|nr:uncharacterized protein LOC128681496 [Plodia interpunctella]